MQFVTIVSVLQSYRKVCDIYICGYLCCVNSGQVLANRPQVAIPITEYDQLSVKSRKAVCDIYTEFTV